MRLAALFFFASSAASAALGAALPQSPQTPAQVVEEYCRLDMQGARLSSNNPYNDRIFPLVDWENEPGWDGAEIVKGYRVLSTAIGNQKATVTVEYQLLGTIDLYTIHRNPHTEKVAFTLNRSGGRWKIAKPLIVPHVSSSSLIANFQDLLRREQSPDFRSKYERVIAELQAIGQ